MKKTFRCPGRVGPLFLHSSFFIFHSPVMPQREFEITIAPDGSVELHVKGYKGKSCLEAMKIFEQVVGELKSQRETSEFYEPDERVQFNIERKH